jgi:hypothetical protein
MTFISALALLFTRRIVPGYHLNQSRAKRNQGCNQPRRVLQPVTRCWGFAFTMKRAHVIETHEHAGEFKEW